MLRNRLEDDEFTSSDDEIIGPSSPIEQRPVAPPTEPVPEPVAEPQAVQPPAATPQQPLATTNSPEHANTTPPTLKVRIPTDDVRPKLGGRVSTSGIARFKAAGHAVIHARAMTQGNVGAEPGVDVRKSSAAMLYGHVHEKCEIEVVDFNEKRATFKRFENGTFREWINSPDFRKKPNMQVRWINVGGLSWDIISELGLKYDLHPLALEDVLSNRKLSRSKADYYTKHLFLRILCHQLVDDETAPLVFDSPRSISPSRIDSTVSSRSTKVGEDGYASEKEHGGDLGFGLRGRKKKRSSPEQSTEVPSTQKRSRLSTIFVSSTQRRQAAESISLEELKKNDRVPVALKSMFIFLCRDGTVISFHHSPNLRFTAPISLRLKAPETSLRSTGDPSMLVHALIDLVVDKALEIVEAYHDKIQSLEHATLLKNKLRTVRALHILSGDLILLKRTMEPLKQLVYGLRRYDLARATAVVDDVPGAEVKGFMSHKAKVYLADVVDHVEHIMSSLDMFSAVAENLMNYTFNVNSSQTNEIMRRFTVVTIICLPLTLLTGYFGMNFAGFDAVMMHSDALFWEIAIPVVIVVIIATLWADLHRMVHYVKKQYSYQKRL